MRVSECGVGDFDWIHFSGGCYRQERIFRQGTDFNGMLSLNVFQEANFHALSRLGI